MTKATHSIRLSLCILVVSACAQGVQAPDTDNQELPANGAGAAGSAGVSAQAGSHLGGGSGAGGALAQAGAAAGGGSTAGAASGGAPSAGGDAGGNTGNAGSTAAGSTSGGATSGGSTAMGGASSAGQGNGGSAGANSAPCSGGKPEQNCSCQSHAAHDYWFCPTARDFPAAEAKCVSVGLHLAKVTSQDEDQWLNSAANAATLGEYYLGSTDASTPNTWTWLAGGTFWTGLANGTANGYAHWNSGEPNASGDCVVVQTGFVWDDRACTDQRKYICD